MISYKFEITMEASTTSIDTYIGSHNSQAEEVAHAVTLVSPLVEEFFKKKELLIPRIVYNSLCMRILCSLTFGSP